MTVHWAAEDGTSIETFESYLRNALRNNVIDHVLRATTDVDDVVKFYVHPDSKDGSTLDFKVTGNTLYPAHPSFEKPNEPLLVFLNHKGTFAKADSTSAYFNALELFWQAYEADNAEEMERISKELRESEELI